MELIVDGYNLIGAEQGIGGVLEPKRNWLIQRLAAYHRLKKISITVVFDGWRSGSNQETSQKQDGVTIVYSRLGEKADSVIIRRTRAKASGTVVISSDREIRNAVERFGAVAISSGEFGDLLRDLESPSREKDDEDGFGKDRSRVKHGSKSERRRREALQKLRV